MAAATPSRRRAARTRTSCAAPASCARARTGSAEAMGSAVVDRLRLLLNRPLRDGDRRRLFVVAVAVILVAAGAMAGLDDSGGPPRPGASTGAAGPPAVAVSPPPMPAVVSPATTV